MEEIKQLIQTACAEMFDVQVNVVLTRPEEQFGDFATNVALKLSKQVGKNPREIAEAIAVKIREKSVETVKSVEIAGPGFINITLTDNAITKNVSHGTDSLLRREKVDSAVIETNNPNPFKAMHIGHAYNAIVADTIANLLESSNAEVHRVSYHGDVGAHVGRSMWAVLKYLGGDVSKLDAIEPSERNKFMSKMYAEGSRAYKEDETVKPEIDQLAVASFTREDPLYAAVYDRCIEWSFAEIDSNVARLGNKPIERRYMESQADALGVETVKAHVPDVFVESDGALLFPGSKYGSFDNVFVGSSGRGLYAARDLGLMQLKHRDYPKATKSYIITGGEQRDYFNGVIKAAELCLPELSGVTVNMSTGLVKLSTGKMSSRTGEVLEIGWLFDQLAEAVRAGGSEPSDVMIASALRYEFLKVRIGGDVIFDVSESVSIQGNSGPYLQYAHARARSILDKATVKSAQPEGLDPAERSLVRKMTEYAEVVQRAANELLPHHVCTYLFELAQAFNRFYEKSQVIGSDREAVRLKLVTDYADTLKDGLELLGIHAPDRM